jgi:hypothetical protein
MVDAPSVAGKARRSRKTKVNETEGSNDVDERLMNDVAAPSLSAGQQKRTTRRPRVCGSFDTNTVLPPSCTSDDENVILKLSFADSNVDPDPYNESHIDTFTSSVHDHMGADLLCHRVGSRVGPMDALDLDVPSLAAPASSVDVDPASVQSKTVAEQAAEPPPQASAPDNRMHHEAPRHALADSGLKVIRLLTEFEEKSKSGEWPSNTSVHCYWCCHRFNNAPFGLPVRYAGDQFHVVGCFCSLECACAHNFASKESIDECLNRYSLINMLAHRLGLGRSVRPAPNRLSLSMFGGHLTIDEFRAFTGTGRQVIVNSPPMMTVTQQVEEVHESDMRSEYKYIPLDNERVSRYQEKIRLKRTKPLVNFKNTLDHTMKLKYAS